MTKFQAILTAVFVLFIIVGVALFATFKNKTSEATPEIVVWGTLPAATFDQFISNYSVTLPSQLHITYIEKNEATFDNDYVQTLARGDGPDAILVPQDLIMKESDKIIPIPYSTLSQRTFQDTFVQEGEMFLTGDSVLALPFSIDPLVMYWNRDVFANQGLATYPRTWSDFAALVAKITVRNSSADISRSAVAMGEYQNVTHAKELLTTLILQAGDPIITHDATQVQVTLGQVDANRFSPAEAALGFFTNFANPSRPEYSWNRSLPESKKAFISGDLATYFGFSSEALDIRAKNPNLNFDVAPLPQLSGAKNYLTYGRMHAFAIAKSSKNANAVFGVLSSLLSAPALTEWTKLTLLPPVRRDLLALPAADAYQSIAYSSALVARSWPDPSTRDTDAIFQEMIESVTTGRSSTSEALLQAKRQLQNFFQ